jgi:hypothetical protein
MDPPSLETGALPLELRTSAPSSLLPASPGVADGSQDTRMANEWPVEKRFFFWCSLAVLCGDYCRRNVYFKCAA